MKHILQIPGSRVTMDTDVENSITVHINGTATKLNQCNDVLYFHDPSVNISNNGNNKNKTSIISYSSDHYSLLTTVHKNKLFYNKKEIRLADEAMQLVQCLDYPSITNFKEYINRNLLSKNKITAMDINRAIKIYGTPSGKKVAPPQSSTRGIKVDLTPTITNKLKHIQLLVDIFYANGLTFIHTKAKNQGVHRHLNYITINHLKNTKSQSIIIFLKKSVETSTHERF